jgi:hypothetical protein
VLFFASSCSQYLSSQLLFLLRLCCNDTSPVAHEYSIVRILAVSTFRILQIGYESTQGYATSNSLYHDLAEGWNVTRFFAPSYCTPGGAQVAGNRHALFLTQWRRFLPETLTVPQPVNKRYAFYRKPTFITAFTTARHLSLS